MKKINKLTVFGDGGSRGNPGEAAYGFAIFDSNNKQLFAEGKRLGVASNNVAEYSSVIGAFEWLINNCEVAEVDFFLDSLLVASQMNSKFRVKHPDMKKLFLQAKELEKKLNAKVTYNQVPRAQNKIADKLVNDALDNLI